MLGTGVGSCHKVRAAFPDYSFRDGDRDAPPGVDVYARLRPARTKALKNTGT